MAQPAWLKKYLRIKPEVNTIFDDLDNYRNFCVTYGHRFNEADLYNERSSWGDFLRFKKNPRIVKDNWANVIKQTRDNDNA